MVDCAFVDSAIICPSADAPLHDLLEFGLSYNGYERLAGDPEALRRIVDPVIRELDSSGTVPGWAGLDMLRGALFYLQRLTHHWGDVPADQERQMRVLVTAIRRLCQGRAMVADNAI